MLGVRSARLFALFGCKAGCSKPNQNQSWSYDISGNRSSDYTGSGWTYDNLNRMTASPGAAYKNSPPPEGWTRLRGRGGASCECQSEASDHPHLLPLLPRIGRRGSEYVAQAGTSATVTDYGLGARGIDYISQVVNGGGANISFPIYDAHGNMVATLSRGANGTYTVGNQRAYGAWSEIRQGNTTGDPKGRYCANLGHKQDDESGLTYMRARYYDGVSGRFISEDSARQGLNWYVYASSQPPDRSDNSGCDDEWEVLSIVGNVMLALGQLMMGGFPTSAADVCNMVGIQAADFIADRKLHNELDGLWKIADLLKAMLDLAEMVKDAEYADGALSGQANFALAGYMACVEGALLLCDSDMESGGLGANWGFDPTSLIPGGDSD